MLHISSGSTILISATAINALKYKKGWCHAFL